MSSAAELSGPESEPGHPADRPYPGGDRPYPSGIPEATVARLPVYLRALYTLAERGVSTVASDELARAAGRQLGQAPQGPEPPGLLRHQRRRL